MTPKIPQIRIPLSRRRYSTGMDDSGWSDDEDWTQKKKKLHSKKSSSSSWSPTTKSQKSEDKTEKGGMVHVTNLLDRNGKRRSPIATKGTFNLLSSMDIKKTTRFGRDKAVFDFMSMVFLVIFLRELNQVFSTSPLLVGEKLSLPLNWVDGKDMVESILNGVLTIDPKELLNSWAPYAFAATILSRFTIHVFYHQKVFIEALKLSSSIGSNVEASQLYLRLISGIATKKKLPSTLSTAAREQFIGAVEIARLRSFAMIALLLILATTVSVIKPVSSSIISTLIEIASLSSFREWPVDWELLGGSLKDLIIPLGSQLLILVKDEFNKIIENPMSIASTAYLCVTLVAITQIPSIECRRASKAALKGKEKLLNGNEMIESRSTESISNMGISSAHRLQMQSNDGAIDDIIMKWNMLKNRFSRLKQNEIIPSNQFFIQKMGYFMLISVLSLTPIALQFILNGDAKFNFLNEIVLLAFTHRIAKRAVFSGLESSKNASIVSAFTNQLLTTTNEVESTMMRNPQNDLHHSATASPTKGISVSDLWAAHVTKR
jgi:hypothetical protein